jgi:hypothetical protein
MTTSARNDFEASLDALIPPADATPPLRALWHGLRGDWEAAHEIVQAEDDNDSAWIHAWLHRVEGDLANARYWYNRAGRAAADGETRAEGLAIAQALAPQRFK